MGFLRGWFGDAAVNDQSDGALLKRFLEQEDQAAFQTLFQRYSGLVMRVCRQVLQNSEEVNDAFQATFIVLARKAQTVKQSEALAGWLHRVALHIALQARARAAKRQTHEKQVAAMRKEETVDLTDLHDVWPILHDEVNQLPAKYRTPVVLCYLDGKTNEEAASQLNWPVGTVKTRLAQGREMLRDRLQRRGVVLPIGLIGAALLGEAQAEAAVSPALMEATLRAVSLASDADEAAVAAELSADVSSLADSAIETLFVSKFKAVAALVTLSLGIASTGTGLWWYATSPVDHSETAVLLPDGSDPQQPGSISYLGIPSSVTSGSGSSATGSTSSGYATTRTSHPHAELGPASTPTAPSSRQSAEENPQSPPSRTEQYNKMVQDNEKAKSAQQPSPAPNSARPSEKTPDPTSKTPAPGRPAPEPSLLDRWWEWVWFPW